MGGATRRFSWPRSPYVEPVAIFDRTLRDLLEAVSVVVLIRLCLVVDQCACR
jgi:hypothetical protein